MGFATLLQIEGEFREGEGGGDDLHAVQDSAMASMTLLMVLKERSVFGAISSEASIYFMARFVDEATAS